LAWCARCVPRGLRHRHCLASSNVQSSYGNTWSMFNPKLRI
jgi:hypothetical protein